MDTKATCKCGAVLKVKQDWVGRSVRCPRCNAVLSVASPSDGASAPEEGIRPRKLVLLLLAVAIPVSVGLAALAWRSETQRKHRAAAVLALTAAREAEARDDWGKALEMYQQALAGLPEDSEARRGIERVKPEADKLAQRTLAERCDQLVKQARAAEASGDLDGALSGYKEALKLLPASTEAQAGARRSAAGIAAREQAQARQAAEENKRKEEEGKRAEAEARELAVRAQAMKEREKTYPEYLQKVGPFYDSLLRGASDLEVGITYVAYGERVREMNYQRNKWKEASTATELQYPSAVAMVATLDEYVTAEGLWGRAIKAEGARKDRLDHDQQIRWGRARGCLQMARLCMDSKDVVSNLPCKVCDGTGKVVCLVCAGSGKCTICDGNGQCWRCDGTGRLHTGGKCDDCDGTGKCSLCKGTGKCTLCGGSGSETCDLCLGEGLYPPKHQVRK